MAILVDRVSGGRADLVPDDLWERVTPLLPPAPERRRCHPGRLRVPDRTALAGVIPPIRGLRGRPCRRLRRLYADRAYDFDKYRRLLWKRGIKPMIARRGVAHGSGLGKVRWTVERAFA